MSGGRDGLLGPERTQAGAVASGWTVLQYAAFYLGLTNLIAGSLGLLAPLVLGNEDQIVNINPGKFLGISGINLPHGLIHAGLGLAGVLASRAHRLSLRYMEASALAWALLTVMYLVAHQGGGEDNHMVMGLAIDNGATTVHIVWTGLTLLLAAHPVFRRGGAIRPPAD